MGKYGNWDKNSLLRYALETAIASDYELVDCHTDEDIKKDIRTNYLKPMETLLKEMKKNGRK